MMPSSRPLRMAHSSPRLTARACDVQINSHTVAGTGRWLNLNVRSHGLAVAAISMSWSKGWGLAARCQCQRFMRYARCECGYAGRRKPQGAGGQARENDQLQFGVPDVLHWYILFPTTWRWLHAEWRSAADKALLDSMEQTWRMDKMQDPALGMSAG